MYASENRYSSVAIVLHWLIALLIIGALAVGIYMADLRTSPEKIKLITYHKWTGVTILGLVALRILWRLGHRPPTLPLHMSRIEIAAAHLGHFVLYILMIATPIIGWLMSSAHGRSVNWFNIIQLPDLVAKNHDLAEILEEAHEILAYTLLALVVVHVLAALKHHFMDKDGLLGRMIPGLNKNNSI